ncbi:hypothetical protein BHM03_00047461 [Ensete ventricosum]|nr:hypothetical protein BHM03_00047461 [Ensete ventricosum]
MGPCRKNACLVTRMRSTAWSRTTSTSGGRGHHGRGDSKSFLEDDDRPGVSTIGVQPRTIRFALAIRSKPIPTLSSDSADSLREQVRQVHQRLDEVKKEVLKSKGEVGESSKGGSPVTPEIQDKPLPTNFRLPALELYDGNCDLAEHIREKGLLKAPNPMKICFERRDKRRYCHFHREHGHDTRECRDLQNQIEELMWHGHLRRSVRNQSSLPDNRPPRDPSPRPKGSVEKQINIIIGGPASGGNSSSACKAYVRTEVGKRPEHEEDLDITFGSRNEEYPCHDDALVISIRMANPFQKLGLTNKDLVSLISALTGFTGDSVSPIGVATILVTFGEEPRSKTLMAMLSYGNNAA